jgi:hypothetical protein
MRGRIGVGAAALVAGVVLLTAGCGGSKAVEFQPASGSGADSRPTVTVTQSAAANGTSTDAASGVTITRNGDTVCVRGPQGGTACTSGHGTVVVDGITVKDGVVVSGNGGAVKTVPPRPTKGTVRISGAATWSGSATGTCEGHATGARTVTADLPGAGKLEVRHVGDGVTQMRLVANGTSYGLNHVGDGGPVTSSGTGMVIKDARLGKGGSQVVVNGDFDC